VSLLFPFCPGLSLSGFRLFFWCEQIDRKVTAILSDISILQGTLPSDRAFSPCFLIGDILLSRRFSQCLPSSTTKPSNPFPSTSSSDRLIRQARVFASLPALLHYRSILALWLGYCNVLFTLSIFSRALEPMSFLIPTVCRCQSGDPSKESGLASPWASFTCLSVP